MSSAQADGAKKVVQKSKPKSQPSLMQYLIAVFVLAVSWVFGLSKLFIFPDEGFCLDSTFPSTSFSTHGECFFSDDYFRAREVFRRSARAAHASLSHHYPVEGRDDLTTDVAVLKGDDKRFLVHMSGVHGPEGHAGSAVQSALLQSYASISSSGEHDASSWVSHLSTDDAEVFPTLSAYAQLPASDRPTLILVHAVNPYGFSTGRRVDINNVDLNRNFLKEEEWDVVLKRDPNIAGYVDLSEAMNPKGLKSKIPVVNDIAFAVHSATQVAANGLLNLKRALVSGNYHEPTGVGYGGDRMSLSASLLIAHLQRLGLGGKAAHDEIRRQLTSTNTNDNHSSSMAVSDIVREDGEADTGPSAFVFIDVHTGLGPEGVDTLAGSGKITDRGARKSDAGVKDEDLMEHIFPLESGKGVYGVEKRKAKLPNSQDDVFSKIPTGGLKDTVGAGSAAMAGYELTVGMTSPFLCQGWMKSDATTRYACVTQEFGTVPSIQVGFAMIMENACNYYGPFDLLPLYRNRYRDCFYVKKANWKKNVARRGVVTFAQGLHWLMQTE